MTPLFLGMSGTELTSDETAFFTACDPAGFVLFRRNITDRGQLRRLTDALRTVSGRTDVPILIDQEGGRVARMRPPEWPAFPPGAVFGPLYDRAPVSAIEAMLANAQAIGTLLAEVGITVDLMPLLDVPQVGAHDIIGDRALGRDPVQVAALGRATIDGLARAGVIGVIKHMPGHGRALVDSHVELPVVTADADELETDIRPFRTLADASMAMTAHVVYRAWDPDRCASLSPVVIGEVIRGTIGFDGLLMSDDLCMDALGGGYGARTGGVIAAGCDIALHCSGVLDEMDACAAAVGEIGADARRRLDRALATVTGGGDGTPYAALAARRDAFLALA
ncbi:beta-N-acetylhexosaminidase [Sphingomonas montana]|uniref:beta-N-acetylhexosaminidase n=1 Tax=Sphingomonas montana TaxID=1843236 RepID=UPI00096F929D|nr:beta-N-acetylhexosaminidase [Sphingomonas montana]